MHVLGINPDGGYFKVALLTQIKGRVKIRLIQEYRKEGLDLEELKKEILAEGGISEPSLQIASMLTPEAVLVRELFLPLKSQRAVLKALPFQLEGILPPTEQKVMSIPFIKKGKRGSDILLYNITEESMEKHLVETSSIGFDPDFVTTTGDALKRFAAVFVAGHPSVCIVHFGWEKSYFACVKEEKTVHNVTLNIGFKDLINAIKIDSSSLEGIDFAFIREQIEECLIGSSVFDVVRSTQKQVLRVLEFLKRKELMEGMEGIVFTGHADILKMMIEKLETFELPIIQPTPHLEYDRYQITSYALELGIAFEFLERKKGDTGLRVGSFTPEKISKQFLMKRRVYLALLVVWGSVMFLGLGALFLKKQEKIKARFHEIAKLGGESILAYPMMQKGILTDEGCRKEVAALIKKLESKKQGDGIFITPPKAAACLEWTIKLVNGEVSISNIHYILEKYPTIEHPDEKYLVRVFIFIEEKTKANVEKFFHKIGDAGKAIIEEKKLYEKNNGFEMELLFKGGAF
jgi:hypothetical protein